MKKEVSPAVMIGVIAVFVLALAFFFWRRVATNPPTPTDNVESFIQGGGAGPGVTPPETAPPVGQPVPNSPVVR